MSLHLGAQAAILDAGTTLPRERGDEIGLHLRYRFRKKWIVLWIGARWMERVAEPTARPPRRIVPRPIRSRPIPTHIDM